MRILKNGFHTKNIVGAFGVGRVSRIAFDGTAEHSRVAAFEWLSSVKPKGAPELVASFELTYEEATR